MQGCHVDASGSCGIFGDWRRGHELGSSGHPKTAGPLSIVLLVNLALTQHPTASHVAMFKQINAKWPVHIHFALAIGRSFSSRPCITTTRPLPPLGCVGPPPRSSRGLPPLLLPGQLARKSIPGEHPLWGPTSGWSSTSP